jgi:hypothetical protein
MYVTNQAGEQQQLVAGGPYQLHTEEGVTVPPHKDSFHMVWLRSYVLSVHGEDKLRLSNPKQHVIRTANDVKTFML